MKFASKIKQTESLSLACADASNRSNCNSPEELFAIKKNALEQRKLAAFTRELIIIKAQCDAGLEPAISIAGTCYLSKRSHATVYRDIQKRILLRIPAIVTGCAACKSCAAQIVWRQLRTAPNGARFWLFW